MNTDQRIAEEIVKRKAVEEELKSSYDELRKAHEDLKETHKSLLQNEKMASLGILSAGVAHEINNPVGYILSNITTLGDYIPQITASVRELEAVLSEITEDNPLYEKRIAAEGQIQKNELNYLLDDTKELVNETREGAIRVLDIVRGLKDFSHADDDAMSEADINKCILSTLNLVSNELKYHCQIETSLGDIPPVKCSISKLGQVFMNIMVNAGHATTTNGVIKISSEIADDCVLVRIQDNGTGMSEEVKNSIFEPFFTTKEKGLGTGLGLAISNGIVEEHGGSIDVESAEGEGTTFSIFLPINKPTNQR